MAYDKTFYEKYLRKDRHDAIRARIFDEWREGLSEPEKAICDFNLDKLLRLFPEKQAKALLMDFIVLDSMSEEEFLDRRIHGFFVQRQFEYAYQGRLLKEIRQELV